MSHNLEFKDGKAQMAYVGKKPWHGLGNEVPAGLTPEQFQVEAGLDWDVSKIPAYVEIKGKQVITDQCALVRSTDDRIISTVPNSWFPVQNSQAFEFFNNFIEAGDMEMETAGSLQNGKIVWALAKVGESFELFKGDKIDSYLLFTNYHMFGYSTDIRFTPVRVECNNMLTMALNGRVDRMARFTHRNAFNPELAKIAVGVAAEKLEQYKEAGSFLGSKKAKDEDIVEYFNRIFPILGKNNVKKKTLSKKGQIAYDILDTQPGADQAPGTWWNVFNAATFVTNHYGDDVDNRLTSLWYGTNRRTNINALNTALEMAEAA